MRVKSIVLDGFKSYAHRKALDDLSPHFNAITGLNGSGKSNIFDAICFVMGITNLKRVRAEDPRELIFRSGTTGVHAARVTIEFINDDPRTAPPGYSCEEYPVITVGRQIKLGGKQQFFLNNTVSMQSKVKRFFESISLNVDNPHFMVLQGTVHKLIGMRSQDILSLIEEAVGTKAFDHRRRTAESLIRGKEKKMQEIDDNIETQIGPMLRAMKADQEEYERFVQMSEGIEEMRRFRIAFDYDTHRQQLEQRRARRAALESDVAAARTELDGIPTAEDNATRRLLQLQSALTAPAEAAVTLREEEATLLRQVARDEAQARAAQDAVRALDTAVSRAESDRANAQTRVEQCAKRRAQREELLTRVHAARDEVMALKRALQLQDSGVRAGTSGRSLAEERAEAQRLAVHHTAQARRAEERLCEVDDQFKRATAAREAAAADIARLERASEEAQVGLTKAEEAYAPAQALEAQAAAQREEVARLRAAHWEANDALQREAASAQAQGNATGWRGFDVPYDRRAVPDVANAIHGRVAQLVTPRDARYGIALSAGGGAQLMRVVVATDADAARLITHGGLRQRTAFMPLNTLQRTMRKGNGETAAGSGGGGGIDPAKLAEARRIAARFASEHRPSNTKSHGDGNGANTPAAGDDASEVDAAFVAPASDLVFAANESLHRPVANAVFGSFLVCASLRLAQELAYAPGVRCKAVSLDGDVAEPSGLLTGGATQQLRDVFAEAESHAARRAPVDALARDLQRGEAALAATEAALRRHAAAAERYKSAEPRAAVAAERLRMARAAVDGPLAGLEAARAEAERYESEARRAAAAAAEQCARLEAMGNEDPDAQRSALRAQLKEAAARHAGLAREEAADAAEFERTDAETTQLVADLERKAHDAREEMAQRAASADEIAQRVATAQEALRDVTSRREGAENQRAALERDVDETQQEIQRLVARRSALESAVKNADVELRDAGRGVDEAHRALSEAERRHPWIAEERETFDFSDSERTAAKLQALREAESQAAVMSKRLNRKATVLYEERRREYDELVQQRAALGEDRDAIQQCILGIEDKKWQALDRMVRVVSTVFSRLFATCLPGASAALREERDAHNHLSGLQVRVMFNGKEKESLSELSGGQRSLLALCLILAILRVRQAPMYILDEVDAALDPSHTQNIGKMLQTHFPTSQFVLVSLKDGMFNNADVLYQVTNTQGYSEIARIASAARHNASGAASI